MVREKDIKQYGLFRAQRFLILFIVSFCFFVAAKPAYAQASFLSASEQVLISELMSANESLLADGRQGIDFKKNILNGSNDPFASPKPCNSRSGGAKTPGVVTTIQLAISDALLEVVSQKTGYPAEMLELSMELESDLGIDSIKRVEILGSMEERYPDLPKLDPEELAELRTLGQITILKLVHFHRLLLMKINCMPQNSSRKKYISLVLTSPGRKQTRLNCFMMTITIQSQCAYR